MSDGMIITAVVIGIAFAALAGRKSQPSMAHPPCVCPERPPQAKILRTYTPSDRKIGKRSKTRATRL